MADDVMTESDLLDDLTRLLRDGLVYVDSDPIDAFDENPAAVARFALTAHGYDVSTAERLFRSRTA